MSSALGEVVRASAAAYGYTLVIATSISTLVGREGPPSTAELFLFAAGGLAAFAALDLALLGLGRGSPGTKQQAALPLAAALDVVAVGAALGAVTLLVRALSGPVAWLLGSMAATALYLVVLSIQLEVASAVQRRRGDERGRTAG